MKYRRKRYTLLLCLCTVFAIGFMCRDRISEYLIQANTYYLNHKKADMDYLLSLDIPVLQVDIQDELEPSYEILPKPEGFWADGVISKEYLKASVCLLEHRDTLYHSKTREERYGAKIRIRGNTSVEPNKKSFKIKLSKKYDLIQRNPYYADKEWVLLACQPKHFLTNYVGFEVCKNLGKEYVPRYKYVNLVVNGNYRGVYVLTEQIERGENKINISDDGVLLECDAFWWVDKNGHKPYFQTDRICVQQGYSFKYPKQVSQDVFVYSKDLVDRMEESIVNDNYFRYIDVDSWCLWLLGHDILGTFDCGGSNIYVSKKNRSDSTLLKMPCLWDFDTEFLQPDTCFARIRYISHNFYFHSLLQHDYLKNRYDSLWFEVGVPATGKIISNLNAIKQSSFVTSLEESRKLDFDRWDYYLHLFNAPPIQPTIYDEIDEIIGHLEKRKEWISKSISSQNSNIFRN